MNVFSGNVNRIKTLNYLSNPKYRLVKDALQLIFHRKKNHFIKISWILYTYVVKCISLISCFFFDHRSYTDLRDKLYYVTKIISHAPLSLFWTESVIFLGLHTVRLSSRFKCQRKLKLVHIRNVQQKKLWVCLCRVYRPTREFFTHMGMSQQRVKLCIDNLSTSEWIKSNAIFCRYYCVGTFNDLCSSPIVAEL